VVVLRGAMTALEPDEVWIGHLSILADPMDFSAIFVAMVEPSERLSVWMDGYVAAWSSNDAADIAALFTEDAVYDPQTADGEWDGREAIVERWLEIDDTPGNWDFQWIPLVETEEMAVIVGQTEYADPPMSYRNLFVIHFDETGLCEDFTEWYIEEDHS